MASPFQYTISAGTQREDVPRPCEIFRARTRVDCRHDRLGTVVGGYFRFDASPLRVDRERKGSAVIESIPRGHQAQFQGIRSLTSNSQTDQSARVSSHEVDGIRSDHLRSNHEIALVLAVFVIDDDNHPSSLEFRESLHRLMRSR